ncbi:DUF3303 family protein [Bradyrhizobium sp. NP1]|jgi:hypothetical protein|uniref:DUF3303 domain-containing protein n=1 Tax=Bradyrhizobium sp. NP1 TaxID=3049772 RepID=UPI0025A5DDA8|nr:DUF3303 family protein [Bradyrhizobium sp. NP1]WJR81280.1 DUF3303 family protein [Bradyrhizobium sp. NP1]
MKYISHWKLPQGTVNAAIKRFLETGGSPPEGVKMLGRWHGMNGEGFAISESSDPKAMYQWYAQWIDVLDLKVTPCVEDAEAGPILASLPRR